jgi:hypothetical protein
MGVRPATAAGRPRSNGGTALEAIDLGAPALASANRIVTSVAMKVGAYTIANASSADGLPRNVTCTRAVVATGADTPGTILVTGTDVDGRVISESLIPGADTILVSGTKAFKTVTSVVGAGWVIAGGNDTIVVGFGTLVGLPRKAIRGALPVAADIVATLLNRAIVAATIAFGGTPQTTTVDASAATYDGTKRLVLLVRR